MIYIFTIIFSVIQCNTVKFNLNVYTNAEKLAYSINNSEKIEISSFNEYFYLKTLELDVSKNYDIRVYYFYQNIDDNYTVKEGIHSVSTSLLMQLEEYYNVKKNNNDFNIMFCPNGTNVDETGKIFFEFLKNNNFPKILITSNNNRSVIDLGEIELYDSHQELHYLQNEFIWIQGYCYFQLDYNGYIYCNQLYYVEKNMMFYICYLYDYYDEKAEISTQAGFAKFVLKEVNETVDNREQFKSIPKVFIITGVYKFDTITTSIFVKAGFSYSYLDSENYYPIFFKTSENFQPIKTEVKEYDSTNFFSITTFDFNNSQMTK